MSIVPNVEFTIVPPHKPLYIRILAALCLTVYIGLCYYFLKRNDDTKATIMLLYLLGYIVLTKMVIPYVGGRIIYIDFTKKYVRSAITLGRFTFKKKWNPIIDLKYISVFKTENGYEVNLWYEKNKILNLFVYDDMDEVIKKAFLFADKFGIDLSDARERGYHKWINKEVYRLTGKIEYVV